MDADDHTDLQVVMSQLRHLDKGQAEMKETLRQIHAETKATNGRVRELESWRASVETLRAHAFWLRDKAGALAVGALLAGLTAIVAHFW